MSISVCYYQSKMSESTKVQFEKKSVGHNSDDEYDDTVPYNEDDETSEEEVQEYNEDEVIHPGFVLKGSYLLLKKIGSGNNASVWMTYHILNDKFLAMKIQDHLCYNDGCREVTIVNKISEYGKNNPEFFCVQLLDHFYFELSDNIKYVCSIYELYAGSIHFLLEEGKYKYGLPLPVVKTIIKQLLTSLSTLHGKLNIIHSDVKPENILFKGLPDYQKNIIKLFNRSGFREKYTELCNEYPNRHDNLEIEDEFMDNLEYIAMDAIKEIRILEECLNTNEELIPDDPNNNEKYYDSTDSEDYDYSDNSDYYDDDEDTGPIKKYNERLQSVDDCQEILDCKEICDLDKEYNFTTTLNNRESSSDKRKMIDDKYVINCQTALTDFGNSYFFDKRTRNEIQDRRYRAPEVILDLNYTFCCDIWSVACVAYELATGYVLFDPFGEHFLNRDLHHLFLIEKIVGEIPLAMKKKSKRRKFLFDKSREYHIKNVDEFKPTNLETILMNQYLFNKEEAESFANFLMCGLSIDPATRSNADELLKHPWLNDVN